MSRDTLLSLIDPDPEQPRKHFDEAGIAELAQSMEKNGLVVPVLVRPVGDRFVLVHGERRYRAARVLGWKAIPAEVREVSPDEARWLSLIENVQRADLSPIEEARAYQERLAEGITQQDLADRIGKTRTYIAQKLRLLTLPDPLQLYLARRALTEGHARQVLKLRGIYTDDLKAAFTWEPGGEGTANFAEPATVFALLRDIRPEDAPVWWFLRLLKGDKPDLGVLCDGCASFCQYVIDQGGTVDQWAVAAFWWASFAIDAGVGVADLGRVLDAWEGRFLSAVAYFAVGSESKPPASDWQNLAHLEWWGHWSDLRHSNALKWATEPPEEVLGKAVGFVLRENCYIAPSNCQPWGFHTEAYEKALAKEGGSP